MPGGTFPVHLGIYIPSFRSNTKKKFSSSEIRDNDFFFKVVITNSKILKFIIKDSKIRYNGF